jgi:tetratricopeptide (TPR) repeat protein
MRSRRRITGRRFALCAVLSGLALLAGCSGAGKTPRRAEIDSAIALFVSAQYELAIDRLDELARTLDSDEALREVYYYLGRSHLALGQHHRAIDAFSAGVSYGDAGACVEYLEQLRAYVEGGERSVRRSETVTRAQLAAALARRLLVEDHEVEPSVIDPGAVIARVVARGWMEELPDGSFHGEAPVTRAAFYVVLARASAQLGYGQSVVAPYRASLATRGDEPVTGAEVSAVLEELAVIRKQHGG